MDRGVSIHHKLLKYRNINISRRTDVYTKSLTILHTASSKRTHPRGPLGLPIERSMHFAADKPLSVYADEARSGGHIAT